MLEETFGTLSPVTAGAQAREIERALVPHRLDAVAALDALRRGMSIGHTVAVLESRKD